EVPNENWPNCLFFLSPIGMWYAAERLKLLVFVFPLWSFIKYIPRPTRSTMLAWALTKVVTGLLGILSHCLLCEALKTMSSDAPVKDGFTKNLSIMKYCSSKGKLD